MSHIPRGYKNSVLLQFSISLFDDISSNSVAQDWLKYSTLLYVMTYLAPLENIRIWDSFTFCSNKLHVNTETTDHL